MNVKQLLVKRSGNARLAGLLAVLLAAALLSACVMVTPAAAPAGGEAPAPAQEAEEAAAPAEQPAEEAQELDQITLRLSWRWKAEFAPLVVADDMGFFEEQGIDVELLEGKGSGDVVPLIANQTDDFGYLNLTTVAVGIGKELPVKVVAGLMGKHPSALAFYSDLNIKEPKDLEGHSIALAPGEAFAVIYPAFAEKWELDTSKIQTVQLDPNAKNQVFLDGKVDILPVSVNNELPQLREVAEKEIDILVPGEWGFNTLANGIITHNDTIAENPDLVRRVVAAVVKGYEYSLEHPEEAVDAVMARSEELASQPREVLLEQVQMTLDFMHSDATKDKPIGWMSEEDWNRTIDLMAETGAIEERLPNETFYTNEFVPGADEVAAQ
jgi:ABC-type nitrate/sulfonate/bicarbonate transport system substrate-binding protein